MNSKAILKDIKNFISEANIVNVVTVTKPTPRIKTKFEIISMLDEVIEGFRGIAQRFIDAKLAVKIVEYQPWHKLEDNECAVWKIKKNSSLADTINQISNIADFSQFDYDVKTLRRIAYYVIAFEDATGKKALFYGRFGNANILDRKFSIFFGTNTFQQLRKGLTFSENIDCIVWKSELLTFNQRNFETIFDYYESLKDVADEIVKEIKEKLDVINIDKLSKIAKSDKRMLIKMAEMKENKSIEKLDLKKMHRFFRNREQLRDNFGYIKRRTGKPQITFNPSIKERWKFIKLLNEDYYESGTTKNEFIATSKRKIP